ncbi:nitrilase-related carbon-nitrogen hydrolase [Peribacillus sp. NJ4]|uniref:nitrilase-related carbon-nitrogen hydrolase n=1 Tax=Peribacillus sp. NJ4 TaxID=3055862 RepID=UPI00338D39EA
MGIIICYDLRFPEIIRDLGLQGIQVLHIVAEWPLARETHWNILLRARAIENQMYVVASKYCGHTVRSGIRRFLTNCRSLESPSS